MNNLSSNVRGNVFSNIRSNIPVDSLIPGLQSRAAGWFESRNPTLRGGLVRSFDSSANEYFSIDHASQTGLDFTVGDLSISLWVNLTSSASTQWLVHKGGGGTGGNGWDVYITGDTLYYRMGTVTTFVALTTAITAGKHHIAVTHDRDGTVTLYVDGVSAATGDGSLPGDHSNVAAFGIGAWAQGPTGTYTNGEIYSVAIWSSVLSGANVTTLFNSGTVLTPNQTSAIEEPSQISFWPLNETNGDAYDKWGDNDLADTNTVGSKNGPTRYALTGNAGVAFAQHSYAKTDLVRSLNSAAGEYFLLSHATADEHQLGTKGWTISTWFNPTDVTTLRWIYRFGASTTNYPGFALYINNGLLIANVSDGSTDKTIAHSLVGATWHHVAITYEPGGNWMVWLDGVYMADTAFSSSTDLDTNSGVNLLLGTAGSSHFDGQLAHFTRWNSVFSESQINAIYNSGAFLTPLEMLDYQQYSGVSYYPLNEPSGDALDLWGDNDLADTNTVGSTNGPSEYLAQNGSGVTDYPNRFGAIGDLAEVSPEYAPLINLDGHIEWNAGARALRTTTHLVDQPATIFIQVKVTDDTNGPHFVDGSAGGRMAIRANSDDYQIYAGSYVGTSSIDANMNTLVAYFNEGSSELFVNGVSVTTGNPGAASLSGLTLGGDYLGGSQDWEGVIKTCVVLPFIATTEEIEALTTYFS